MRGKEEGRTEKTNDSKAKRQRRATMVERETAGEKRREEKLVVEEPKSPKTRGCAGEAVDM